MLTLSSSCAEPVDESLVHLRPVTRSGQVESANKVYT